MAKTQGNNPLIGLIKPPGPKKNKVVAKGIFWAPKNLFIRFLMGRVPPFESAKPDFNGVLMAPFSSLEILGGAWRSLTLPDALWRSLKA